MIAYYHCAYIVIISKRKGGIANMEEKYSSVITEQGDLGLGVYNADVDKEPKALNYQPPKKESAEERIDDC